ncbi:MAG: hypothetical protein OXT70_01155 [Chloroflexota bacterium]|nr:hypothetical protein [Chloroflexota bacterium]
MAASPATIARRTVSDAVAATGFTAGAGQLAERNLAETISVQLAGHYTGFLSQPLEYWRQSLQADARAALAEGIRRTRTAMQTLGIKDQAGLDSAADALSRAWLEATR